MNLDPTGERVSALGDESSQMVALQAAVDDFLHAAVHDIRGPLGQVRALTVLLERQHKQSLNADGQELCRLIEAASRRAMEVVEAIREYAQVLERPVLEAADLNAIVDSACYAVRSAIDRTGASITREDLPSVQADRGKLLILFQELFRNALKFRGETPPRVHCSSQDRERQFLFSVVDNGVGVPAKHTASVFQPLKRLHGRDFEGTGMGLAICHRIVEMHGGKIWVESHSGGGSNFCFTLPHRANGN